MSAVDKTRQPAPKKRCKEAEVSSYAQSTSQPSEHETSMDTLEDAMSTINISRFRGIMEDLNAKDSNEGEPKGSKQVSAKVELPSSTKNKDKTIADKPVERSVASSHNNNMSDVDKTGQSLAKKKGKEADTSHAHSARHSSEHETRNKNKASMSPVRKTKKERTMTSSPPRKNNGKMVSNTVGKNEKLDDIQVPANTGEKGQKKGDDNSVRFKKNKSFNGTSRYSVNGYLHNSATSTRDKSSGKEGNTIADDRKKYFSSDRSSRVRERKGLSNSMYEMHPSSSTDQIYRQEKPSSKSEKKKKEVSNPRRSGGRRRCTVDGEHPSSARTDDIRDKSNAKESNVANGRKKHSSSSRSHALERERLSSSMYEMYPSSVKASGGSWGEEENDEDSVSPEDYRRSTAEGERTFSSSSDQIYRQEKSSSKSEKKKKEFYNPRRSGGRRRCTVEGEHPTSVLTNDKEKDIPNPIRSGGRRRCTVEGEHPSSELMDSRLGNNKKGHSVQNRRTGRRFTVYGEHASSWSDLTKNPESVTENSGRASSMRSRSSMDVDTVRTFSGSSEGTGSSHFLEEEDRKSLRKSVRGVKLDLGERSCDSGGASESTPSSSGKQRRYITRMSSILYGDMDESSF